MPTYSGPSNQRIALVVRLDETSSTQYFYVGKATSGALTSQAVWQVARFDLTNGVTEELANGSYEFDQVWDNRLSLTYL